VGVQMRTPVPAHPAADRGNYRFGGSVR
jgi:hypothetical protein